jgi:hypothetical protein
LVNKVAVAGFQVAHAGACPVRCRPDSGDATHALVDPCQRDRDVAADRETAGDHTAARHVVVGGDPVQHHIVSEALWSITGHMSRRNAPMSRSLRCVGDSVERSPCCHGSILTAKKPAPASRSSMGSMASFVLPRKGSQILWSVFSPHRRISVRRDWMILSVGASGWLRPPSQQPGHAIS